MSVCVCVCTNHHSNLTTTTTPTLPYPARLGTQALYDICFRSLKITNPTYKDLNHLISGALFFLVGAFSMPCHAMLWRPGTVLLFADNTYDHAQSPATNIHI